MGKLHVGEGAPMSCLSASPPTNYFGIPRPVQQSIGTLKLPGVFHSQDGGDLCTLCLHWAPQSLRPVLVHLQNLMIEKMTSCLFT